MFKNWKLLIFIVPVFMIGTIGFMLFRHVTDQCDQLLNIQPDIDLPPGSELLRITSTRTGEAYSFFPTLLGATERSRVVTEYVVNQDYVTVISFYKQHGTCSALNESNTFTACSGQTQPFGNYYISITHSVSSKTHFIIQIDWSLCGSEL